MEITIPKNLLISGISQQPQIVSVFRYPTFYIQAYGKLLFINIFSSTDLVLYALQNLNDLQLIS